MKITKGELSVLVKKVINEQKSSETAKTYSWSSVSSPKTSNVVSTVSWNVSQTKPSSKLNTTQPYIIGYNEIIKILLKTRNESWDKSISKTLFNNEKDIDNLAFALVAWVKKNPNYNPELFKTAVALLFRESKASPVMLSSPKEMLGSVLNFFGGDHSQGYAQIKPSVAKKYGININDLYQYEGSLNGVYKMLSQNYKYIKNFYKGSTVTIFQNGKLVKVPAINNDAALHMTIAAHNAGLKIINKWCETNIPNIANSCDISQRKPFNNKPNMVAKTNKNKVINNYFPNIGNVHDYMPQVKKSLDNLTSLPNKINEAMKK